MVDENWSVEGAVKICRCISLTQNVQGKFSLMMKAVGKYIMKQNEYFCFQESSCFTRVHNWKSFQVLGSSLERAREAHELKTWCGQKHNCSFFSFLWSPWSVDHSRD